MTRVYNRNIEYIAYQDFDDSNLKYEPSIVNSMIVVNTDNDSNSEFIMNAWFDAGIATGYYKGEYVQIIKDKELYYVKALTKNKLTSKPLGDKEKAVIYHDIDDVVKRVIALQKRLYEHMLLSAEFINRLHKKGYDTAEWETKVNGFATDYENNFNYIKNHSKSITTKTVDAITDTLEKIANGKSIGFVWNVIILAVIVAASASIGIWWYYHKMAVNLGDDCRECEELNKILAKVDPETKEELYNFINRYADKAYKTAVARTKWGDFWGSGRSYLMLAIGGYCVYKLLNNYKK